MAVNHLYQTGFEVDDKNVRFALYTRYRYAVVMEAVPTSLVCAPLPSPHNHPSPPHLILILIIIIILIILLLLLTLIILILLLTPRDL